MSDDQQPRSPRVPHTIRRFALPILLFWVALAAITNIAVPQLEEVGKTHNVALNSPDAPSLKAIKRIGEKFHEFDTDSSAMIVLEGDKPLGADAHRFYDEMIAQARAGQEARRARSGLLGRHPDRGGIAERRRQGRLRPAVSCG